MLVKVKQGDQTFEFDSTKVDIAILLTPKDKESIEKMDHNDLLIVSAPLASVRDRSADLWNWAMHDWQGATYVDPNNVRTRL